MYGGYRWLFINVDAVKSVYTQCCRAEARTFWSEPEPVYISGSTLDEKEQILNDVLFVRSNIDKRLIKKQILQIN